MDVRIAAVAGALALLGSDLGSDSPNGRYPRHEAQLAGAAPRPVLTDQFAFTADVSRDGRKVLSITRPFGRGSIEEPSRLEIRDLVSGQTVRLTGGESPAGSPGRPAAVWSRDGRHVAYTWLDAKLPGAGNLNVIAATEGATPRIVVPADASDRGVIPHGWSADGRRIFVLIHGASDRMGTEPTSFAWVSIDDGTIRPITTHDAWRGVAGPAAQPRLSPDGTMIAYSAIAKPDSTIRAIYVMSASGEDERAFGLPGSSTSPVWSPDSRHVVFVNTRDNQSSVLAVPVSGVAQSPLLVQADLPNQPIPAELVAMADTGTLFYRRFGGGLMATVAERGRDTARTTTSFFGYGAAWIDSERLAFIRNDHELIIRSAGGTEQTYARPLLPLLPPRMFSTGAAAVLYVPAGADRETPVASFYRVDLRTGAFTHLFPRDTPTTTRANTATLSPDDTTLYVPELTKPQGPWARIAAIDLATGNTRSAVTFPREGMPGAGLDVSPDGRLLALHATDGRIVVMSIAGESQRELTGPSAGGAVRDLMRWTPDGRHIVYVERDQAPSTAWRLMRVAATGGLPQFDGIASEQFKQAGPVTDIDLSPDGSRLAFTMRTPATFDLWAFEAGQLSVLQR